MCVRILPVHVGAFLSFVVCLMTDDGAHLSPCSLVYTLIDVIVFVCVHVALPATAIITVTPLPPQHPPTPAAVAEDQPHQVG